MAPYYRPANYKPIGSEGRLTSPTPPTVALEDSMQIRQRLMKDPKTRQKYITDAKTLTAGNIRRVTGEPSAPSIARRTPPAPPRSRTRRHARSRGPLAGSSKASVPSPGVKTAAAYLGQLTGSLSLQKHAVAPAVRGLSKGVSAGMKAYNKSQTLQPTAASKVTKSNPRLDSKAMLQSDPRGRGGRAYKAIPQQRPVSQTNSNPLAIYGGSAATGAPPTPTPPRGGRSYGYQAR